MDSYPTLGKMYESRYTKPNEAKLKQLPPTKWDDEEKPDEGSIETVQYEGDEYPRVRIPVGSKTLETEPLWALTKEGRSKFATEGVPAALHKTADTVGSMVFNPGGAVKKFAKTIKSEAGEALEDPFAYAEEKYSGFKETSREVASDPVEAAQTPTDVGLALLTRTPLVQRALRLRETPLDEGAIATVAAEKTATGLSNREEPKKEWFPETGKALTDLSDSYEELGEMARKDPRYAGERELADNIAYLLNTAFGADFPYMEDEDPFAAPMDEEVPVRSRRELTSQKVRK
jgi:hypothetical protein